MSVKYGKFEMPDKISREDDGSIQNFSRFFAEPFERGFGHTIGNSLRRIILSALEAPAIISLRIEGVEHEYMSVKGIVEDMTNIILNLKGALLRKHPSDENEMERRQYRLSTHLVVTADQIQKRGGQYAVTLGDIVQDGLFSVVNPELYLFSVTQPMKREVEVTVSFGRGYMPAERIVLQDRKVDDIVIDAIYTPVRLVNYRVENTRVGQDTDYDKLIFEVTTDGRITPAEAVSFAAQIATKHYSVFQNIQTEAVVFDYGETEDESHEDELLDKLGLRIDEIELSVRSANCLSGANIDTIAELVAIPERRMLEFRNFGKKSLNEIKDKLREMGLGLGMDLSRFGITQDNAKEKIKEFRKKRQQQQQ